MAENGGGDVLKLYDVSMLIHEEMMVYKNDEKKRPQFNLVKKIPMDNVNESSITMNLHTGTHIDAPYHMNQEGDTIDQIDLSKLLTPCFVLDLTAVQGGITKEDLCIHKIEKGDFILLKTMNSFTTEFSQEFIYLEKSGAEYLAKMEICGVGIDALGIERSQPNHDTHKTLMKKGIIIIEGLQLKDVSEGNYFMCALPLKIKGADGAPARVVLIEGNGRNCLEYTNIWKDQML